MKYREIDVLYDHGDTLNPVGRLATTGVTTVFEYDDAWVKRGIELSPFELPVEKRSFQLDPRRMISATFGLFADSLPDGWGLLIMDRQFKKRGIDRKDCQSALKIDPPSASKIDPPQVVVFSC